jgi:hypothetical protein
MIFSSGWWINGNNACSCEEFVVPGIYTSALWKLESRSRRKGQTELHYIKLQWLYSCGALRHLWSRSSILVVYFRQIDYLYIVPNSFSHSLPVQCSIDALHSLFSFHEIASLWAFFDMRASEESDHESCKVEDVWEYRVLVLRTHGRSVRRLGRLWLLGSRRGLPQQ